MPRSVGIGIGICHGGSLWTPDMLPSGVLQGYHRADDPAIVLSSGRMQSLPDKLAGKPALTKSNASWRPLLDTTTYSKKSLYFDGARAMQTASNVSLKGKFAFIAVMSMDGVAWAMEMGNTAVGTGAGGWIYSDPALPLFTTRVSAGGGQSVRKWAYASPYYGQPCVVVHYCDGTDAGHKLRINGVEWPLTPYGAPYNTNPGASNVASNPIYYANRGDVGGSGCSVFWWWADLYLQDWTMSDITNVEQFLMREYGMSNAGEGCCIGDSTSAKFSTYQSLGYHLRGPAIDPLQCRVIMKAFSGDTPTMQKTRWDTASPKGVSSLKWINYLCGVNRIFQDASAATIRDEINTHLNSIRTTNPSVKIMINTLLPCYQRIVDVGVNVAARQAALEALNTMIRNGEITAADAVIDMYAAFGDVSDSRKLRIANTTDGIHEDDAVRAEMATLIDTQLAVWGLY